MMRVYPWLDIDFSMTSLLSFFTASSRIFEYSFPTKLREDPGLLARDAMKKSLDQLFTAP